MEIIYRKIDTSIISINEILFQYDQEKQQMVSEFRFFLYIF